MDARATPSSSSSPKTSSVCFSPSVIRKINDWQCSCCSNGTVMPTHTRTLSRRVGLCMDLFEHQKKANALQLCQHSRQPNPLYMLMMPVERHTRIDKQTNKQIRYCRSVLWFLSPLHNHRIRHSPVALVLYPNESIMRHTYLCVYTNEMATSRNLRFWMESRTGNGVRTRGVHARLWVCVRVYTYRSARDTHTRTYAYTKTSQRESKCVYQCIIERK